MKALTLTEPWALLVALNLKRIETRSWNTNYRGPLAIHAGKGFPEYARERFFNWEFREPLEAAGYKHLRDLPRGAVVAVCNLVAVKKIDQHDWQENQKAWEFEGQYWETTSQEHAYGDYTIGRYMWFLDNITMLSHPVEAKGALSLWEWPRPVEEYDT